ncbi:MAG: [FeFe] hydrogenase H-cluster radical SAM maturase HydG [Deltaproteobacteria bacterium]|nr:[FeFe] hydrogenase H-cluster radical SAM maturase HydG [Deltaproteobacteria bacterium]
MSEIIQTEKITQLVNHGTSSGDIDAILNKALSLSRLELEEAAALLNVTDEETRNRIHHTAKMVKSSIYGNRLVIFAPLYISNLCKNDCAYCGFRVSNRGLKRKALSMEEITSETEHLLRTGQKRVLMVSGEAYPRDGLNYVLRSIDTIYNARVGEHGIRRINVNIAPVETDDFRRLREHNIGTYQLFQETYHKPTYHKLHTLGPKTDYDYRLNTIGRAFHGGIDDVGIGVLFGLYNWKYEVLSILSHVEYLEREFGMGPHTISVPRLEPATGSSISTKPPFEVTDEDFKLIISVLRLAVPYIGLILSTRETPEMRKAAFELGISQISAGSKTNPGGYGENDSCEQFSLGDHRSLDDVIYDVVSSGFIPSFCTSCYRLGRTGLDFMEFAKPGEIKKKCQPNALITFTEYLLDFASDKVKNAGMELIARELAETDPETAGKTKALIQIVRDGKRDVFV